MVAYPRAPLRPDQLRPLNRPRSIRVQCDSEHPIILIDDARRSCVTQVLEIWRIDDEWWRTPISRRYYRLILTGGHQRTVYHDLITDAWYAQEY